MAATYTMIVFDANHLARRKQDDKDYLEEKEKMLAGLNEMATLGWRVVGQSTTSEQSYLTDARLKTGVGVQTKTRLIYTLIRETP